MQLNNTRGISRQSGISLNALLFMAYFFLAPMEDILNSSAGTLVKYLAIVIIGVGLLETKGIIELNKSIENKCIIWLMLVSAASVLWSIDRAVTSHRIISYLLIPAFCLFASTLEYKEKEFRWIVTSAIAGGLFASFIAYRNGNILNETMAARMVLTEGNDPNNFAAFLLLPLTLSWWRIQESERLLYKIIYSVAMVFLILIILMTGSRGALLSALIMYVVYYLVSGRIKRASAIFGGAILVLILLFVLRRYLPTDLISRLFTISNYTSGGAGRTEVWNIVLQEVIPHMDILGLGAGCGSIQLTGFYGFAKGVHNTYLNMICEFGVFGIPAFLAMLIAMLKKCSVMRFYIGVALLASICTDIFFLDSYGKKFFWNVILLLIIYDRTTDSRTTSSS